MSSTIRSGSHVDEQRPGWPRKSAHGGLVGLAGEWVGSSDVVAGRWVAGRDLKRGEVDLEILPAEACPLWRAHGGLVPGAGEAYVTTSMSSSTVQHLQDGEPPVFSMD